MVPSVEERPLLRAKDLVQVFGGASAMLGVYAESYFGFHAAADDAPLGGTPDSTQSHFRRSRATSGSAGLTVRFDEADEPRRLDWLRDVVIEAGLHGAGAVVLGGPSGECD